MPSTPTPISVIGGGLAGSEAAWQLAERGHEVVLHEMRPVVSTPAHKTDRLAELVCSNTFKSTELSNALSQIKATLASDEGSRLVCHRERKTGTNLVTKRCETVAEREARARASQEQLREYAPTPSLRAGN